MRDTQAATRALGLRLQILQATNESEIDGAFASLARQRPDALIVHPDTYSTAGRQQIVVTC